MSTKTSISEDCEKDVTAKTVVWLGCLGLLYAAYVWSFYLTNGFGTLGDLSLWRVIQKGVLVAAPVGIIYLWAKRRVLIPLDYHLSYAPFLAWAVGFYFAGRKKGVSNAYVELQIVTLLSAFYLLRCTLQGVLRETHSTRIAVGLFLFVLFAAFLVPFLIPVLPD